MALFVLLVIFHVNGGSVLTTQEFFTKTACENAINIIHDSNTYTKPILAECISKK